MWNRDCKSFNGVYSCDILKSENYKDCSECKFYEKIDKKILIIKLGAMGDVLRTTTILPAIKKKYGRNTHITWLILQESKELLENNQYIDKILTFNQESLLQLQQEKFDILYSLEINTPATLIPNLINAEEKFGYYFDKDSHPNYFNESAKTYLENVFSDYKNLQDKRTYQEMLFEITELEYEKQPYILNIEIPKPKSGKIVGINIGSGDRWSSKAWHSDNIKELITKLPKQYKVILLGGPEETESLTDLTYELKSQGINVETNNPNNTIKEFISVLNKCDLIVTGDTLALHLAIALKKKVIALFFCTPDWQIESYNLVEKIKSPLLDKYFMSDEYSEELTKSIQAKEVLERIKWNL